MGVPGAISVGSHQSSVLPAALRFGFSCPCTDGLLFCCLKSTSDGMARRYYSAFPSAALQPSQRRLLPEYDWRRTGHKTQCQRDGVFAHLQTLRISKCLRPGLINVSDTEDAC